MGAIKLKHTSGNGTILNSPAANPSSDITLKLPSTTGSAGQVLSVASANHSSTNAELEFAAAAGGKVKQYKYAQSTTLLETTSSSYQNLSATFSVAITPTSSSNLLLARFAAKISVYNQSGSDANSRFGLTDDGASSYLLENDVRFYDYGGSGGFIDLPLCIEHVKVAGNTNARTYSIRYKLVAGNKVVINNYSGGAGTNNSVLSVMEIEP